MSHNFSSFGAASMSRRKLLKIGGCGFGYLAWAGLSHSLAQEEASSEIQTGPLLPKPPHFAPKAKRVIFMFMQGGPSHIDTFDYKPELASIADKEGKDRKGGALMASPFKFQQHGESGLPLSELFPNLAQHADDLCLVNSMHTDNPAHPQAGLHYRNTH